MLVILELLINFVHLRTINRFGTRSAQILIREVNRINFFPMLCQANVRDLSVYLVMPLFESLGVQLVKAELSQSLLKHLITKRSIHTDLTSPDMLFSARQFKQPLLIYKSLFTCWNIHDKRYIKYIFILFLVRNHSNIMLLDEDVG